MPKRFESLVDMQERACEEHARRRVFGTKEAGVYRWMTYKEFGRKVDAFRGALAKLNVRRGDKVAVIANNRVEWAVGAYATYGLGAHYVPMYEAQHPKDWRYILEDSGSVVVLTSSEEVHKRALKVTDEVDSVANVICFEAPPSEESSFARHLELGQDHRAASVRPKETETAGLIYTSGTTGNPKGVVLSHGNIVSNINAVHQIFPMTDGDVSCSFLPWAHSFGQTCELHCLLSLGAAIGIAESVDTLTENLVEVRPTLLFAVPRVFNKIYAGLQQRMATETAFKRGMFERGMEVARRRRKLAERNKRSFRLDAEFALYERLLFSKVKARFGGRLQYVFSGGAALSKTVAEFIDDIGILVFEGYGLTETSPIVTTNAPDARKLGTVGRPIPGVEVFICDEDGKPVPDGTDGEVVVVGPNLMQGYHNQPDATAEVIFELDGMRAFKTGDMGQRTRDGFIKITGRFKEQYKLENGRYVVPTPLEDRLKLSQFISQAFIFGDNKPHNVCLVVPDFEALKKWASQEGIGNASIEALSEHSKVHAFIGKELERFSEEFKGFEKPKAWALLSEEFSTENNMLTPKMSVKRRQVVDRYKSKLEALY